MLRRLILLTVMLAAALSVGPAPPARAQSALLARARYALPVYRLPDATSSIVGVLVPQEEVVLEARDAAGAWVLGHSADGSARGWIQAGRLSYVGEAHALSLPIRDEAIFVAAPEDSVPAYPEINLNDYPVIPLSFGQAAAIAARGRALGVDPGALSKVGDCLTDNPHFLSPFAQQAANFGAYPNLGAVVEVFRESLGATSHAALDGLVTSAVLDPTFANPFVCQPGETPLRCEYRIRRPSVAIIMFGAQDLLFTPADVFNRNLRQIVHETIAAGAIPLLSTFPGHTGQWERAIQYNQIVVRVALDYRVPLINLWRALEPLPNHGLTEDGRHLTPPLTHGADLTPANLQRGLPLRNLITLQVLDALWRAVG